SGGELFSVVETQKLSGGRFSHGRGYSVQLERSGRHHSSRDHIGTRIGAGQGERRRLDRIYPVSERGPEKGPQWRNPGELYSQPDSCRSDACGRGVGTQITPQVHVFLSEDLIGSSVERFLTPPVWGLLPRCNLCGTELRAIDT